jgi:2-phospho-L-lactate guanylyltransferase (CobY/MobA/RfbA family)
MAKKYGLSVRILHDSSLAVDIDTADDLAVAQQLEN